MFRILCCFFLWNLMRIYILIVFFFANLVHGKIPPLEHLDEIKNTSKME